MQSADSKMRKRKRLLHQGSTRSEVFRWATAVVYLSATWPIAMAQLYMNRDERTGSTTNFLLCRLTTEDTIFSRGVSSIHSSEETVCVPVINEIEDIETYSIQVSEDIQTQYKGRIKSGNLYVLVKRAEIVGNAVLTTNSTTFSVLENYRIRRSKRQSKWNLSQIEYDATLHRRSVGKKRYALVRISTMDSTPTYSLDHMVARFTDPQDGMQAQYRQCSHNRLQFNLAASYDVQLPLNLENYETPRDIWEAAMHRIISEHNITDFPYAVADHFLWCIPPGTGAWVANAATNHWRSTFNNVWCLSLGAIMHELGHNLGLGHSHEGGDDYGDITGYMGSVVASEIAPKKCFNPAHHHELGWYFDQTLVINPLNSGKLVKVVAFTDAAKAALGESVILNLGYKYFIQFNRAKLFNAQTEEYQDRLIITESQGGGSILLAALHIGESHSIVNYIGSGQNIQIKVCEASLKEIFSSDVLVVGIGKAMDPCVYEFDKLSGPTALPTRFPSSFPSAIPSDFSESFPSSYPSHLLSKQSFLNPTSPPSLALRQSTEPSMIVNVYPSTRPSAPLELYRQSPNKSPTALNLESADEEESSVPSGDLKISDTPSFTPSNFPILSVNPNGPSHFPISEPSAMPSDFPWLTPSYNTDVSPSVTPSAFVSDVKEDRSSSPLSPRGTSSPSLALHSPYPSIESSEITMPSILPTPDDSNLPLSPYDNQNTSRKRHSSVQNWQMAPLFRHGNP